MKIVFGIDGRGQTSEIGQMLRLAIVSCRANTSHELVVVADKFEPNFASWLESLLVLRFTVETPMAAAIRAAHARSGYPLQAIGNYLRYEACKVLEDDFFLYCDCDTIFLKDFLSPRTPKLVAAVAEDNLSDWSRFNSGVLFVNRNMLLRELEGFYDFAKLKLEEFYPGFDQATFNVYFDGRIERLAPEFNWRPYWGSNSDAIILHTHGVKPSVAEMLFQGVFVADHTKQDFIQNLVISTLTNMPSFSAGLAPFQDEQTALAWLKLAGAAQTAIQMPLRELFSQSAAVRHATIRAWRDSEISGLEIAAIRGDLVEAELTPAADSSNLRLVLSSNSLLIGLTDVVGADGCVLDIRSCTKYNVSRIYQRDFGGKRYWIIEKYENEQRVDLVFTRNIDGMAIQESRFTSSIIAFCLSRVKYYWSNDDFYKESSARNAYVYYL